MQKSYFKRIQAVTLAVLLALEVVLSVILSTTAEEPSGTLKSVKKDLLDFSGLTVSQDIQSADWPEGISKMDSSDNNYSYNFNGTVDIAENSGDKFLKFNFDSQGTVSAVASDIASRTNNRSIFVKVSVPSLYIPYLKDISVDYLYNYKQVSGTDTAKQNNLFYILGMKSGTAWGKDIRLHYTVAPTAGSDIAANKSVNVTDMKKLTASSITSFTKNTTGYVAAPEWTADDLDSADKIDVLLMVSAPNVTTSNSGNGHYFGIKNIAVTLEGPANEIDNIDNPDYVDPHIVNFDEADTLAEIRSITGFEYGARSQLVTDDVDSAPNAFLFRRHAATTGQNYDVKEKIKLDRASVVRSEGVTFMAKNISDKAMRFRIWIAPGNAVDEGSNRYASRGKYQYVFTLPANMTEYQRVSFYWDNVGKVNFSSNGEFWDNNTSGYSITQEELASGLTLTITNPGIAAEDAGTLFDSFEYITPAFAAARKIDIVNFQNSDVGKDDIPANITIGGTYGGSAEIVEDAEGNKGLRLNYDKLQHTFSTSSSEGHHLRYRPYFQVSITVPKGLFSDATSLSLDVTNNRDDCGSFNAPNQIYTAAASVIAISSGTSYGKVAETVERIDYVGDKIISAIPENMLHTSFSNTIGYQNKATTTKWTAEELKEVDTIHFFLTAPYTDGTEGESFTINSIYVNYNEPPTYEESEVRDIFATTKAEPAVGDKISVSKQTLGNTDPNFAEFSTAFKVDITAGNTEGILFTNDLTAYLRNLAPFKDQAVFHLFSRVEKRTTARLVLKDKNGAEISYEFEIAAPKTKLYVESSINFKDIYDFYKSANPDGPFDLSDIKSVALYFESDIGTVYLAKPEILTGAYVRNEADPESLKKVNAINFDNCDSFEQLPIKFSADGFSGSKKMITKADGSKALRVNYDVPVKVNEAVAANQAHQLVNRSTITFSVTVPAGSMKYLQKINYTVDSNAPAYSENKYTTTYYQTIIQGGGYYFKGHENSRVYTQPMNQQNTIVYDLYSSNTLGTTSAYAMGNWLNKASALSMEEKYLEGFTTIILRVAPPECRGDEGYWFELSSIDLEFSQPPVYDEENTRTIVESDRYTFPNSDKIKVTEKSLASNDKNYRKIKTVYEIDAKKGNTEPLVFINGNINFLRNAATFLDTANFRIYAHSPGKYKLNAALVNFNDERLPFTIDITKTKDEVYDEYIIPLKKIYQEFLAANPNERFSLNNITAIEILPDTSSNVKLNIAGVSLWTKEPGTGSSAGNYYRTSADDDARIEGYQNAIAEDFETTIEVFKDINAKIKEDEIRIPAGAKPVAMVKFTLRNSSGEVAEPNNSFWISIKVPAGVDMSDIGIYRVFLDGSLVKLRHAIEPNGFISCNTFFSMDTFIVLSGVKNLTQEAEEPDNTSDSTVDHNTETDDFGTEVVITDETENEQTVITTPSRVVRKKKIVRLKNAQQSDTSWIVILIICIAAAALLTAGVVVFIIVRKRRKIGKGNNA